MSRGLCRIFIWRSVFAAGAGALLIIAAQAACGTSSSAPQADGVPPGQAVEAGATTAAGEDSGASAAIDSGESPLDGGVWVGEGGAVLTASGGTLPSLYFAVVGDTRPPLPNDTAGYPTAVITKIFTDLQNSPDSPPFVVGTGDYQFSILTTALGNTAAEQLDLYLAARNLFSGQWYPAMGNHECTPLASSNCIDGGSDLAGNDTYPAYGAKILAPQGRTLPYYTVHINAIDGSWTSKFVFAAANAWDDAQSAWFQAAMNESTTYTFVIRHEEEEAATPPPGVAGTQAIMATSQYTLAIVGHEHTYERTAQGELLVGNGGAPLSDDKPYGYALLRQRASDGAIVVDMYDADTNDADTSFHFAVTADGGAAPP